MTAPPWWDRAHYHCISRVVDQQFHLGPMEREKFVNLMREYSRFCGVQIITYNVLANHFHIVTEVPRAPSTLPSDEELFQLVEALSGCGGGKTCRQTVQQLRQGGHHEAAEKYRAKYFARMWSVSGFMKLLKQRFTQWFNKQRGRRGTLWESRFKSTLIEGVGAALATVAAYVDLNAVRANLVEDPASYRWCGYAEAMAGGKEALEGLKVAVAASQRVEKSDISAEQTLPYYRVWLFGQGEENDGVDETGRPLRKGITREQVLAVLAARGRVGPAEFLRVRVRYFTDGVALGSREFVNEVFSAHRHRFGPRRKSGARRIKGLEPPGLYSMRDLRLNLIG